MCCFFLLSYLVDMDVLSVLRVVVVKILSIFIHRSHVVVVVVVVILLLLYFLHI